MVPRGEYLDSSIPFAFDELREEVMVHGAARIAAYHLAQGVSNMLELMTGRGLDSFKLPEGFIVRPLEQGEERIRVEGVLQQLNSREHDNVCNQINKRPSMKDSLNHAVVHHVIGP